MNINFKIAADGFTGLFQIDGKGPWRTEYLTDSLLNVGGHVVVSGEYVIGAWMQETLGHRLITV